VNVWPKEHPILSDKRLRQSLGEAEYTSSLRGAVEFCSQFTLRPPVGTAEAQAREQKVTADGAC
jgi:hypothetical protein